MMVPIPKQPERATVVILDEPTERWRRAQLDAFSKKFRKCVCGQIIEPQSVVKSFDRDVCKFCHREVML